MQNQNQKDEYKTVVISKGQPIWFCSGNVVENADEINSFIY